MYDAPAVHWSEDGEAASRVELTLTPAGDGLTSIRVVETRPLEILDLIGIPAPGAGGHVIKVPRSVVTSGVPQQLFHLGHEE